MANGPGTKDLTGAVITLYRDTDQFTTLEMKNGSVTVKPMIREPKAQMDAGKAVGIHLGNEDLLEVSFEGDIDWLAVHPGGDPTWMEVATGTGGASAWKNTSETGSSVTNARAARGGANTFDLIILFPMRIQDAVSEKWSFSHGSLSGLDPTLNYGDPNHFKATVKFVPTTDALGFHIEAV